MAISGQIRLITLGHWRTHIHETLRLTKQLTIPRPTQKMYSFTRTLVGSVTRKHGGSGTSGQRSHRRTIVWICLAGLEALSRVTLSLSSRTFIIILMLYPYIPPLNIIDYHPFLRASSDSLLPSIHSLYHAHRFPVLDYYPVPTFFPGLYTLDA